MKTCIKKNISCCNILQNWVASEMTIFLAWKQYMQFNIYIKLAGPWELNISFRLNDVPICFWCFI